MASGASNESIAQRLGISRHTAKEHGRWIYNKLDVHNRAELVAKLLSGQAGLSLV
jgi:DNA-binding CsgD family transcriptional regulator